MWSITKHLEDHADKQRDRSNQQQQNLVFQIYKVELSLAQIEKKIARAFVSERLGSWFTFIKRLSL